MRSSISTRHPSKKMFVDLGGALLMLLTAVVCARAQVAKVPLSEDAISSSERSVDRNDRQDGIYQNTNNYPARFVDTHPNFKPRKISSPTLDQNDSPGDNSNQNLKLFGKDLGSSSDHNNEAALGDDSFEFSAQDKVLFDNQEVLIPDTDLNQAELHENPLKRGVRGEHEPPSAAVGSGGVVRKKEQFNFKFNYTIDVSDMSLACLHDSARQLVLTINHASIIIPDLRDKYAKWAYNTSWEDYSKLIHDNLDARYVPLLPILPEDFNHSVIKSKKTTTPPPIMPDAVTSLDQVLRDTYSVMQLCKAATDSVLFQQAMSRYPLIGDLADLNERLERVLGVVWNGRAKCNVDPNPEPLQHILEFVFTSETVDDIKRLGFLTIYHVERALNYVKHILKEIDPSLKNLA